MSTFRIHSNIGVFHSIVVLTCKVLSLLAESLSLRKTKPCIVERSWRLCRNDQTDVMGLDKGLGDKQYYTNYLTGLYKYPLRPPQSLSTP